ncbi:MAG TPA: Co2+/Mg2+ efflux protein ApaG [Rhodanobacteraceae bacterium]|nr:Co2+/Mg2+ efflux protein ApaG [Rhodanobacteraceae bacterium]
MSKPNYAVDINVESRFLPEQSEPNEGRYVFSYTVSLRNRGAQAAQLLARHWIITDGDGRIEEVRGDGVVGEQPNMYPGGGYEYSSGAVLKTGVGTMRGSYLMEAEDGTRFEAPIPAFVLSIPRTLH